MIEQLIVEMTAINSQLKEKLAESTGAVNKFGSGLDKIAGMMAAAFSVTAVVAFGKACFMAFEDLEKANRKLMFALHGNTAEFGRFRDIAKEVQKTTGVSDVAVEQIQMMGVQAGRSETNINALVNASINLSAITGGDLQGSYQTLIKSYSGVARGLKILGTDFGSLTKEQLMNGDAVKLLNEKYNTFAKDSATDFDKLKGQWNDFKESTGKPISDVFSGLLKDLNEKLMLLKVATNTLNEYYGDQENPLDYIDWLSKSQGGKSGPNLTGDTGAIAIYDPKAKRAPRVKTEEEIAADAEKIKKALESRRKMLEEEAKKDEEEYQKNVIENTKSQGLYAEDVPEGLLSPYRSMQGLGIGGVKQKQPFDNAPMNMTSGALARMTIQVQKNNLAAKELGNTWAKNREKLDAFASIAGSFASMMKKDSAEYKAFAIAQTIFSTYSAATSALEVPPMGLGPVAGIPLAASIIAGGISNLAQIVGVTFAQGGIVPGNSFSGDNVLAHVNSGEMVLNASQQAHLFAIANGGGEGGRLLTKISANDIYLIYERGKYLNSRKG